jgi:hypothetical protein
MFRATYKPVSRAKDASGTAIASPSVRSADSGPSFLVKKISKVGVSAKVAKTFKRNRTFNIDVQTGPDAGIGNVRVTVAKSGVSKSFKVPTDDSGYVRQGVKLTKAGRYKVSVKWLGNSFGAASKTVTKYIVIR